MPSRRALLAALGTASATAGCLDRVRGTLGDDEQRIRTACDPPTAAWPTDGGGSRRTGRADAAPPPADADGVALPLGRRDSGRRRLAANLPVIADGTAFVPTAGTFVAVDLETPGREPAWTYQLDDDMDATPAMACGAVLALGLNTLTALDPASGKRYWQADVGGFGPAAVGVVADRVYVGGPSLTALDARTGEERWTADGGDTVAVDGTGVYSTENSNGTGGVYAHAHDGTERWHRPLGKVVGSASVRDGTVYVVDEGGTVYALEAASGETAWSRTLDGVEKVYTGPAVGEDEVVVPAGNGDRSAVLEAATGEQRWTADTGIVTGRPVVGADWVALGRTNEGVTLYDRRSGDERTTWTRDAYEFGTIAGLAPLGDGFVVRGGTTSGLTLVR
jgi:outer membrane protein assembly factor BamB